MLQPEAPKANHDIPDALGIGVYEMRTGDGELMVYFRGSNTTKRSSWVVLGKFAKPRKADGKQYYVSNRLNMPWTAEVNVTYHDDLLMAVSWIMELKQRWDKTNENLHN